MWTIGKILILSFTFLAGCARSEALLSHPTSREKIDVWVPSYKNIAWTVFNIKNIVDHARSPSRLDIRVMCMTPDENKCQLLQQLIDTSFPVHAIKVHDLSKQCTGIGGSALPCVFSYVLNNTPQNSVYTVIADTDAIVVKNHWDTFIIRTLKNYCMAGINPRAALGAVEWNWLSFQSSVFRSSRTYDTDNILKDVATIKDFKDWGQWWEMTANAGECTKILRFPFMSSVFKDKSPMLVGDAMETPSPLVVHMFYLTRRTNEDLKALQEDSAVMTIEQEKLIFTLLRKGFFTQSLVSKLPLQV